MSMGHIMDLTCEAWAQGPKDPGPLWGQSADANRNVRGPLLPRMTHDSLLLTLLWGISEENLERWVI